MTRSTHWEQEKQSKQSLRFAKVPIYLFNLFVCFIDKHLHMFQAAVKLQVT